MVSQMNKWILTVLTRIIAMASPEILEATRQAVQTMCDKAAATPNPWDDIFTNLLQMLVGKPGATKDQLNDYR